MLHFKEQTPTDNFTSPYGGNYKIKKNGIEVMDTSIRYVIDDMFEMRTTVDKACAKDPFPARHSATFITGSSNWREKAGIWGELDPGGKVRMLLRSSC